MLSIPDYLLLIKIKRYLDEKRDEEIRENNGYTNEPIEELRKMITGLDAIIFKLGGE